MRIGTWWLALLVLAHSAEASQPPPPPADPDLGAALARLIQQNIAAKLPRVYEDASGWGQTIPLPERVRFPRLRRTIVMVDGRPEVPDGLWRKVRLRLEDPQRDLRVRIRSLERLDQATYRLKVDADALVRADADLQRWRNGVLLADLTAQTRVTLGIFVDCALAVRLDSSSLVPRARLEPEIKDLKLTLKDFRADQVTFQRAGVTVDGEALEGLNDAFKESLQNLLRAREPEIKKRAGQELARDFKENKTPAQIAALLDAAAPLLKAADRARQK
jgi:hypothetical protein